MKVKTANVVFWIAIAVGAVISGLGSTNGMQAMSFIGVVLMCAGLMVKLRYCRCPHCGGFIGRSNGGFCQFCGKKINEA